MDHRDSRGFTLVEALFAAVLVSTAVAGLSTLALSAMAQSAAVERHATALWLAQGKLEELRAAPWSFDSAGGRISDPLLALSPSDALDADIAGLADALDRFGAPSRPGEAAAYRRRWSVTLVTPIDPDTLLLRACVRPRSSAERGSADQACVSAIRTRHLS